MCAWQPEAQILTVPSVLRLTLLLIYPTQYARSNSATSALGLLSLSEGSLLQFHYFVYVGLCISVSSFPSRLCTEHCVLYYYKTKHTGCIHMKAVWVNTVDGKDSHKLAKDSVATTAPTWLKNTKSPSHDIYAEDLGQMPSGSLTFVGSLSIDFVNRGFFCIPDRSGSSNFTPLFPQYSPTFI